MHSESHFPSTLQSGQTHAISDFWVSKFKYVGTPNPTWVGVECKKSQWSPSDLGMWNQESHHCTINIHLCIMENMSYMFILHCVDILLCVCVIFLIHHVCVSTWCLTSKIPGPCQLFPQRNIIFHYCQCLRILNFSTQVVLCFLNSLANALTFGCTRPLFPLCINFAFHDFLL